MVNDMKKSMHEMFERMRLDPDGWFLCAFSNIRDYQLKPRDLRLDIPLKIPSGEVLFNLYFMRVNMVEPCHFCSDKGPSWLIKTDQGYEWRVFENECPNPVVSSRSDALDFVYRMLKSCTGERDAVNIVRMVDVNLSVAGILP